MWASASANKSGNRVAGAAFSRALLLAAAGMPLLVDCCYVVVLAAGGSGGTDFVYLRSGRNGWDGRSTKIRAGFERPHGEEAEEEAELFKAQLY